MGGDEARFHNEGKNHLFSGSIFLLTGEHKRPRCSIKLCFRGQVHAFMPSCLFLLALILLPISSLTAQDPLPTRWSLSMVTSAKTITGCDFVRNSSGIPGVASTSFTSFKPMF